MEVRALEDQLVTIENSVPLADSRKMAETLGVAHGPFMTNIILKYRDEVEADFGLIHFENGVKSGSQRGKLPQYAMLTEDQTYVFLAYSKNTVQARACKRLLVKAFADARQQLTGVYQPRINSLWEQRLELFHKHTKIPDGYWCIFGMVAAYCRSDEFRNVHLVENALPDGSVGKHWCEFLREQGYDTTTLKKYPHRFPDKRGVQLANIYPNELLGVFWTWFNASYLKKNYPLYLKGRLMQDGMLQIHSSDRTNA